MGLKLAARLSGLATRDGPGPGTYDVNESANKASLFGGTGNFN